MLFARTSRENEIAVFVDEHGNDEAWLAIEEDGTVCVYVTFDGGFCRLALRGRWTDAGKQILKSKYARLKHEKL